MALPPGLAAAPVAGDHAGLGATPDRARNLDERHVALTKQGAPGHSLHRLAINYRVGVVLTACITGPPGIAVTR